VKHLQSSDMCTHQCFTLPHVPK